MNVWTQSRVLDHLPSNTERASFACGHALHTLFKVRASISDVLILFEKILSFAS